MRTSFSLPPLSTQLLPIFLERDILRLIFDYIDLRPRHLAAGLHLAVARSRSVSSNLNNLNQQQQQQQQNHALSLEAAGDEAQMEAPLALAAPLAARPRHDVRLALDALRLLAILLCHKRFAYDFINAGGVQRLLLVPRPSAAATGVALCLYYLSYFSETMARVRTSIYIL